MITFIVPYKEDNAERALNLDLIQDYYTRLFPESEFILVKSEDDTFAKCELYNKGAIQASNEILCFLDCDIIVSKESLLKSFSLAESDNNVVVGYNGTAIYLTLEAKSKFQKSSISYSKLAALLPSEFKPVLHNKSNLYNVANLRAVGGCLIMSKKCFDSIGRFNPNFKNWGFEDTEIVTRASKMGKNVVAVNTKKPYLFHLPHDDDKAPRNLHAFYADNEREYHKVQQMNSNQIKEYIKTWKV
tara:strand:- start:665 stop:1396 length:732 start_codon:yes stop_codon:yes gene_type:complete